MKRRNSYFLHIARAALAIALGIITNVECRSESPVRSFFVLGDSSVNCGSNTFFYRFLRGNSPSYPCNVSDQRLIPDFLAEKMGLPSIPLFYGQNGTFEGLSGGLNFGSSPATIMNWGDTLFQGLNQQLRQAFELFQILQLQMGLQQARKLVQSSIFYISIGKDDFTEFLRDRNGVSGRHGPKRFARILVHQMIRVVKDLHNANARKIICMGIGPLGCTPRSLWQAYNATGGSHGNCTDEINSLIVEYNSMLSADLLHLSHQRNNTQIVFCDVYRGIMAMIMDPLSYGFDNVDSACCGFGMYGGMIGCLAPDMACSTRAKHVWWDLYNPTEAANALLADWAWSGAPLDICQPITVQQLASTSQNSQAGAPRQQ